MVRLLRGHARHSVRCLTVGGLLGHDSGRCHADEVWRPVRNLVARSGENMRSSRVLREWAVSFLETAWRHSTMHWGG